MKKKEVIFFGVLLLVAAIALIIMYFSNADASKFVHIDVDGVELTHVALNADTDIQFSIATDVGYNTVVILDGTVNVISADCKSQVCVNTKTAHNINDLIVCLPHKVVIEVVGQ